MRGSHWSAIVVVIGLAGCVASTGSDEGALSKDEARARGGKSDGGMDFCALFDWYGDGVCDDFCVVPDPDCETGCGGLAGDTCAAGEFCRFGADATCGAAGARGTCLTIPDACPAVFDPVCGCDGETYANDCQAHQAGVSVAARGACADTTCRTDEECPQPVCLPGGPCPSFQCVDGECVDTSARACGGGIGEGCDDGELCRFADGSCTRTGAVGTCAPRPEVCPAVWEPVCGCDGRTYSNRCNAESAGASVAYDGECVDDCRDAGCGGGRYCAYCWGTFQCIPDGAVC